MNKPILNTEFSAVFHGLKSLHPLVHCITNYVTANDCANMLLACGASPVMADEPMEVCEITGISQGLLINIGTLNQRTVSAMLAAGKKANELSLPVVLDPVGVGASTYRRSTAEELLKQVHFDIIRGNLSEIRCLAEQNGFTRGVDVSDEDAAAEIPPEQVIRNIQNFSREIRSVIAVSGPVDLIVDGERTALVRNGHAMMPCVTGSGCMLGAVTTAFAAAAAKLSDGLQFEAALESTAAMGICGEIAWKELQTRHHPAGNASYRNLLIDAMYNLNFDDLKQKARYEIR